MTSGSPWNVLIVRPFSIFIDSRNGAPATTLVVDAVIESLLIRPSILLKAFSSPMLPKSE